MKILIISHMYPSTFNEVAGVYVHQQVKALKDNGVEVRVISPVPFAPFPLNVIKKKWGLYSKIPHRRIIDGIKVYYPRYIEFPNGFMFHRTGTTMYHGMKNLVKEIYNEFKFDMIHSHVALPDGDAGLKLSKEYNVPHINTIHGQDLQEKIYEDDRYKEKIFNVIKNSNCTIVVSNKLKNIAIKEQVNRNIKVINNGIDLNEINTIKNNIEKKSLNVDSKKQNVVILSAGNLIRIKGIDLNIKAINIVKNKYSNIKYKIIGEGSQKHEFMKLVKKLNLENNVEFLGRLNHEEVIKHMMECDIFSMPSYIEAFGMVYIEAMALGKPVIAVEGQGIADVIINRESGYLVKEKDVEDLANTLDYIISNMDKAKKVGEEGQKRVVNNFTWDINAIKTIETYKEVLKASSSMLY